MACNNYYRAKLILESNKKRWLKVNEHLPQTSGIYILTRVDECGIKYAYIGQTVAKGGILQRLAQHLHEYPPQHIDMSLKKHGLYNEIKNPYGWKADYFICDEKSVHQYEREYIVRYANLGYQLRNKTSGGQDKGKVGIDDNKPSKGYHDGLKQGYENCLKDIRVYFEKYLGYGYQTDCFKKDGSIKEIYAKKMAEFDNLMQRKERADG